ncbi:MAG: hypothetical protein IJA89_04120 [Clostridia bacterium]|nr:hypothetical protein [Clostridia bacterium]
MKKKNKVLLTSMATIAMCASLVAGGTYALFTSESVVNIAVTSATVNVQATIGELTLSSTVDGVTTAGVDGKWVNGGTATVDGDTITLDKMTPGDTVSFEITVTNYSDVAVKARTVYHAEGELFGDGGLVVDGFGEVQNTGVTLWTTLAAASETGSVVETHTVSITLPEDAGNKYQNKTAAIQFGVEAVQGNAQVYDIGTNGVTRTDSELTDDNGNEAVAPAGVTLNDGAQDLTLEVEKLYEVKEDGSVVVDSTNVNTSNFEVSDDSTAYPFSVKIPEVDNTNNDTAIVIKMEAPANLEDVVLFHKGVIMAPVASADDVDEHHEYFYDAEGSITFATKNFSNFTLVDKVDLKNVAFVGTADELVAALEGAAEEIVFENNIKIDPANMSNAYGTTGINIKNNETLNGNGYTLDVKGAGGTWDSGINITGGTIKNIMVTGSFRGIFINHNSTNPGKVYLENVTTIGTVYTISCDQGTNNGLEATNCKFYGWTSFAATLGKAEFVNCTFGAGSGYNYSRPYAEAYYKNCKFEEGHELDARGAVTFDQCTIAGVEITEANFSDFCSNEQNVTVITHVSSGDELQDAINNGNSDIVLDGDIDLSSGLVIGG